MREAEDLVARELERVGGRAVRLEGAAGAVAFPAIGLDDEALARPDEVPATAEDSLLGERSGYPVSVEDAAADINRFLVEAAVPVHRIEPLRASLEERFLELTSRLGVAV